MDANFLTTYHTDGRGVGNGLPRRAHLCDQWSNFLFSFASIGVRLKKILLSCALFAVACVAGRAQAVSFVDGERFFYRVGWGIFSHAGEITIAAQSDETAGPPQMRVTTTTTTQGFIRALYRFDGKAECVFDASGRMLAASAQASSKKKQTHVAAVFDYPASLVRYEDFIRPERNLDIPLPVGRPMDLVTTLIDARAWNLQLGERRPVTVMFDDEFYELIIVAERVERVRGPLGECQALVLKPVMEKDPKGMFKRGGTVHVWISQDERRLPVKFKVGTKVGTGTAWLTQYQSGNPELTAAAR
jgi:hypothetical protein